MIQMRNHRLDFCVWSRALPDIDFALHFVRQPFSFVPYDFAFTPQAAFAIIAFRLLHADRPGAYLGVWVVYSRTGIRYVLGIRGIDLAFGAGEGWFARFYFA